MVAKLKYEKCVCTYCSNTLSAKSTLNRHLATCKKLSELLLRNPGAVCLTDIETRKKQLEQIKKIKEKCFTCAFCGKVIVTGRKFKSHLLSVHNFPA